MVPGYFWRGMVFCFLICVIAAPSQAGEATEQIRHTTDRILAIVRDPELKGPEKKEERERLIRQEVDERFNWEEMSRRTLARHWTKRTDEEKREFIDLFGKLLERTYMDQVEGYSGEKVIYEGERVDGDYGLVKVRILMETQDELPVLYRIKNKGDEWLVYDISIEGVSLIKNYRTQFNSIIARSSYKKLVERLKDKVAQR